MLHKIDPDPDPTTFQTSKENNRINLDPDPHPNSGQIPKKKLKKQASTVTGKTSSSHIFLPVGKDGQGKLLFHRPSDNKLVYLRCCVPGCPRTDFPNTKALQRHVSAPNYHHKLVGKLTSNEHVLELCGQIAPNQVSSKDLPEGAAFDYVTIARDVLRSSSKSLRGPASRTRTGENDSPLTGSLSRTSTARDTPKAFQDDGPYRGTRAQQAKEAFEGLLSSDSEEDDEDANIATLSTENSNTDEHYTLNNKSIVRRSRPAIPTGVIDGGEMMAQQYSKDPVSEYLNGSLKDGRILTPPFSSDGHISQSPSNAILLSDMPQAVATPNRAHFNENGKRATPDASESSLPPSKRVYTGSDPASLG